ncbi:hypothetical protein ACQJ22_01200 [Pseudomonas fragariae (ex Marin et al. 2024)]|uniref:hypothetical protein n=1 Tax=Pseudomonas TaxID=286 RepID=UPI0015D4103B|nr:hypothetical protein [Pseudomonas syringae]
MPVKIDRRGLDQLIKNAEELNGKHQVKLEDLMNPSFISTHSKFADLKALFQASDFKIETAEDFAAIPDDDWDKFISENTDFDSWEQMQRSAGAAFVKAGINKGL